MNTQTQKPLTVTVTATPSLNKILTSRWAAHNCKKRYMKELDGYGIFALKCKRKCNVEAIRYGSRLLDDDNLKGGAKKLWDCLKVLGLIVDDRPEWFSVNYRQEKCKRGQEKTVFTLTYE